MANQRYVLIRRLIEFKEDLRVLLIAVLFIVLTARLELVDLRHIGVGAILFLVVLMLLVRPLAVLISTFRSGINWKEKLFLSWLAPRGIVAAAVASLFSFRLTESYPLEAAALVPIVFLVIAGTVAIYGLSASPVARALGLADPNPQGVVFAGAHDWAREIALALDRQNYDVLLVDSNPANVARAEADGLPARQANILSEHITDQLDLGGIGRLLALTPNDEVNSLAVLHFTYIFDSAEVYQLATREEQREHGQDENLSPHLRGRPLFGEGTSFVSLDERFEAGAEVQTFEITDDYPYEQFEQEFGGRSTPLFVKRGPNQLQIFSEKARFVAPGPGHVLIALVDPVADDRASADADAKPEVESAS